MTEPGGEPLTMKSYIQAFDIIKTCYIECKLSSYLEMQNWKQNREFLIGTSTVFRLRKIPFSTQSRLFMISLFPSMIDWWVSSEGRR